MQKPVRLWIAIAAAVVAALLAVHAGEAARIPVVAVLVALGLWSLREPAAGLLAALPLVYMIEPTPTVVGWRELGFASVLAVSGAAALWRARGAILPPADRRWAAVAAALLALNLASALWHGVRPGDWLRGLAPFVFLLVALPVRLEMLADAAFAPRWREAALATAALFAGHVVQVYVGERLWLPASWTFEQGAWVPAIPEIARAQGREVYEFAIRVTQRLQQATDALLPLGIVWGTWLTVHARRRGACVLGTGLAMLATVAVVLTYTRSMLLAALAVVGPLLGLALRRGQGWRVLLVGVVILAAAAGTIRGFDLEAIYLNRFYQMKEQAVATLNEADGAPGGKRGDPDGLSADAAGLVTAKDANITARLDEYRIAWELFLASPLLGQGLGARHAIHYAAGLGEVIEVQVGYVHNWVMYMLMTGGVVGLFAYLAVLAGPALAALRGSAQTGSDLDFVLATVATLGLYGLFFAVFRLIPFNLVLGGLWGLMLAARAVPASAGAGAAVADTTAGVRF